MSMHPDLKWLARNVSVWGEGHLFANVFMWRIDDSPSLYWSSITEDDHKVNQYTKAQWLQARQLLGLESPEVTEAEDEAWEAMEEKQASNRSKYHREIKPGIWVDVYDVLHAWRVQNPALQHLIKKSLQPGERGHKTREEDMKDIIASALRAGELGE